MNQPVRGMTPRRVLLALVALVPLLGCGAVVRGGRLSDRPGSARGFYLTTGGTERPYRTLGFVQVTGEGRTYAGMVDVGDAGLDGTVRGTLAETARRMGGDGVIHIEFLDENPPTLAERIQDASNSIQSAGASEGVEVRQRTVVVTGEVIQFLDVPARSPTP